MKEKLIRVGVGVRITMGMDVGVGEDVGVGMRMSLGMVVRLVGVEFAGVGVCMVGGVDVRVRVWGL